MHLKILIGVLILGIASASPKAAPKPKPKPKPIAKASPQFYQGYPGAQPNYFPSAPSYFGQGFNPQPILGHDAAGRYDPRFPPSGYQSTFGTAFGAQETYLQASVGNYYQPSQPSTGNYNQPPQTPPGNYNQPPQAPPGNYNQPPQVPSANYYQSPQAPAGSYYQPPQAPAANYYQSPQAPAANYYQSPQAPAANYYQTPQPPAANYIQSPQAPAGNNYQSPQLIPVPVAYPSGSSAQSGQPMAYPGGSLAQGAQPVIYPGGSSQSAKPPNYSESARLWPKALISPAGSPSPVPDGLARAYYAVSTPSPLDFSSPHNQNSLSTQTPFSQQNLIPVPVKVSSGNSFQPEITNYSSIPQNNLIHGSTSANYQQQSTPTPYDQRYLQPLGSSFSTSAPQSPTASRYPVNYKSSPAPFQTNYQQSNQAPPVQASVEQQSTPSPYPLNYQQPTPAPYQGNYQHPGVSSGSPFADYQQQPTSTPNAAQYQQQSVSPFGPRYKPTDSPYQQPIPVPVAYPQSQFEIQPPPPTPVTPTQPTPTTPTPSYPSVPVTSKPINILPTSPTPVNEVSIRENTFVPIPTPSGSDNKSKATIIKSEYSGTVSPQYNHIPLASTSYKYSTLRPFLDESVGKSSYGSSYSPAKSLVPYSSSTDVSQVSFQSLGNSYSY